jgi:hypothetical protein
VKASQRRFGSIAWPAFLMAAVLEVIVFALVDPGSLHGFGGAPIDLSATAVYSIAFFVFWAIIAAAATMTLLLGESELEINSRTFR